MEQQLLLPGIQPGCTALGSVVRKDRDCDCYGLFRELRELGWSQVGDGLYTTVFISPDGDRVLKFADGCGQRATVEAALANPDNPHLPRVFGVLDDVGGYDLVYEAEALEPLDVGEDFDYNFEETYDPDYVAWYSRWKPDCGSWKWGPRGLMKDAIRTLREHADAWGCDWDVHCGNVMRRSDGTLVLNDLLC